MASIIYRDLSQFGPMALNCAYCGVVITANDDYIVVRNFEHVHAGPKQCFNLYCTSLASRVVAGRTAIHRAAVYDAAGTPIPPPQGGAAALPGLGRF